jgi:hypothetical protein
MILLKPAIAAALVLARFMQPGAGCTTSSPTCSGTATFHNFTPSTNCASVRWPKGVFNFCLPGNGSVDKSVPPLSQVCWSFNAVVPPAQCSLDWIYVYNPMPIPPTMR